MSLAAPAPAGPASIRRLIARLGLWITGGVLAGFTMVMTLHEISNRHRELQTSLSTLAGVVATNSEAALMFASDKEANDILASLRASPEVVQARLFLPTGGTLGLYDRAPADDRAKPCHTLQGNGQGWTWRWCGVALYQPVMRHGEELGRLGLEVGLAPTYQALLRSVLFSVLAAAAAFGLSIPLWQRVARRIAGPLGELAETALHVSEHEDFARRAEAAGSAEVVALSNAFNHMMTQLEQRDQRVQQELGQRRQAEARLNDLAYLDAVTGLHNRHHFMERIGLALARAGAQPTPGVLIYIDLDGFKQVNDTLGHDQGDALLRQVGERLRQTLRGGDVVCRLGGDEFAVILENAGSPAQRAALLARLVQVLAQPYALSCCVDQVSASIGACTFPDQAHEREALLRLADLAMYHAKKAGKARYHVYDAADVREPGEPGRPRSVPQLPAA